MIAKNQKTGSPMSLCLMDIDDFYELNDNINHDCGDHLLIDFSKSLLKNIRMFVSSRYGGGEFTMLMANLNAEKAARFTNDFRNFISTQPINHQNNKIDITLSAGVFEIDNDDFSTALTSCYQSLRKAKKTGS
jgi:diguanylate cyclase (GGDEF)-like protein